MDSFSYKPNKGKLILHLTEGQLLLFMFSTKTNRNLILHYFVYSFHSFIFFSLSFLNIQLQPIYISTINELICLIYLHHIIVQIIEIPKNGNNHLQLLLQRQSIYQSIQTSNHIIDCAVGLDLRFYYRGYPNRLQDALPWLEVHLLHAKSTCI